jgi:hypothetical protein
LPEQCNVTILSPSRRSTRFEPARWSGGGSISAAHYLKGRHDTIHYSSVRQFNSFLINHQVSVPGIHPGLTISADNNNQLSFNISFSYFAPACFR